MNLKPNKALIIIIIFILILIGTFLRIFNISPLKIYPDSYQNILVAENIRNYQNVVGYLGKEGMLYPPFVMWSRPVFPLLINLFGIFTKNYIKTAQVISLFSGILAIPLTYFFIKKIFSSTKAAIFGSMLLALSFNHTVWGGFILTETLGVLALTLFLLSLFYNLENKSAFANIKDIITGILFSLAVFTRYEYFIFIIPTIFLIIQNKITPAAKLLNITLSFFLLSAFFLIQLFPIKSTISASLEQLPRILTAGGIILLITFFAILILKKIQKNHEKKLIFILIFIIVVSAAYLVLQIIFKFSFLNKELSGIREFFKTDFLLAIFFFIGIIQFLNSQKSKLLGYFVLLSIITLAPFYYLVNPEMQRYYTHLIPIFLIPSSYALAKLNTKKYAYLFVVIILVISQIFITYEGIRNWKNKAWFEVSYEEKAAKLIDSRIKKNENTILIVSLPEPYYLYTKIPTQSISDSYPHVFIDESSDSHEIFIIQDMGMHYVFPNFSNFLDRNMQQYKIDEFYIKNNFAYGPYILEEKYPINIYKTTLKNLKELINEQNLP